MPILKFGLAEGSDGRVFNMSGKIDESVGAGNGPFTLVLRFATNTEYPVSDAEQDDFFQALVDFVSDYTGNNSAQVTSLAAEVIATETTPVTPTP